MKKLRKMVSVILCVVISCMCMVTPVCAAEKSEAAVTGTNIRNNGVQRIEMYPAIIDSNGNIVSTYRPAVSGTHTNGEFLVNLTVSTYIQSIYNQNNCNCWAFQVLYCSDPNVSRIAVKLNNDVIGTVYSQESSSLGIIIPNTSQYSYFTYELIWYYNDGSTATAGGHVTMA